MSPDAPHGPVPAQPSLAALHIVCGKIAAGKSTLTQALAARPATLRISEDDWLTRLYPGEIHALPDYVRCAQRLRDALGPQIEALLRTGVSVVLDFPANTPATRQWALSVAQGAGVQPLLHWLDVPDSVCLERLRLRNAAGLHPYTTTEAQFEEITRRFVPPHEDEGLRIVRYAGEQGPMRVG